MPEEGFEKVGFSIRYMDTDAVTQVAPVTVSPLILIMSSEGPSRVGPGKIQVMTWLEESGKMYGRPCFLNS